MTTDEMPSHSHTYTLDTTKKGASQDKGSWFVDAGTIGETATGKSRSVDATGKNVAHENLPPMVAAYGWRRTV